MRLAASRLRLPALLLERPCLESWLGAGDAGPAGDRDGTRSPDVGHGPWLRASPDRWRYATPDTELLVHVREVPSLRAVPGAPVQMELEARALRPLRIRRWTVALAAPCTVLPWVMDTALRWRPLAHPVRLCALGALTVRWQGEDGGWWELRQCHGTAAAELDWRSRMLRIQCHLDAAALHPRWSFAEGVPDSRAAPALDTGAARALTLLLRTVGTAPTNRPATLSRHPAGHEATFTITDHCDFDRVDRLGAFLGDGRSRAWLGRGLRLTKGVFTLPSDVRGRPPAPTLADADYRRLVERLHDEGSEIAPHGVNESGQVEPAAVRAALATLARAFAPHTWIDHGLTLRYCYTMGGATDPRYQLLSLLREHGITTLWAYHDAPVSATATLDLLAPSSPASATLLAAGRHVRAGALAVAAHYAWSAVRRHGGGAVPPGLGRTVSALRRVYVDVRAQRALGASARTAAADLVAFARQPDRRRRVPEPPYSVAELRALGPSLFPESAAPLRALGPEEPLLFATVEVVHTRDAYRPAALQRLVQTRGLHVGHCYLLNQLPYIAGIFEAEPGPPALGAPWLAFLDALEAEVAAGRVWNPSMGALAAWTRALQAVWVQPSGDGALHLGNDGGAPVTGVTVLLPASVDPRGVRWGPGAPRGTRSWGDALAVWGDVPARDRVLVQWPAPR